jgi:hypothetical protein
MEVIYGKAISNNNLLSAGILLDQQQCRGG